MSRIGRKPINIPAGVDAKFENGVMTVKGPKGTLTQKVHKNMIIKIENGVITVERPNDDKETVSYTHLDVYKRQPYRHQGRCSGS